MSPRLITSILSGGERQKAKAIGAYRYTGWKRYRDLRPQLFELLDAAVEMMDAARFLDPYDGRIIGGFVTLIVGDDQEALEYLEKRGVAALENEQKRQELLKYIGVLVAEDYLKARRDKLLAEPRIAPTGGMRHAAKAILDEVRGRGAELVAGEPEETDGSASAVESPATADTPQAQRNDQDLADFAMELIGEQIGTYESMVPATDAKEEVPDEVQRRAMAKAAFMRLHVEDLREISAEHGDGETDFPTKDALAQALSEQFRDETDQVAQLVLDREKGNPEHGLITRLLPLRDPPDLETVRDAFKGLEGHYIEVRTAMFFLFGRVVEAGDTLRIFGRIRSFTVNPAEAGGMTRLNAKPHTDDVTITLRQDERWAEVNTRRAADAYVIRSVLRRTGEITPAAEVPRPAPLPTEPYSTWDTRTLWMLDFLQRDLQADTLKLENTMLATFRSPEVKSREVV